MPAAAKSSTRVGGWFRQTFSTPDHLRSVRKTQPPIEQEPRATGESGHSQSGRWRPPKGKMKPGLASAEDYSKPARTPDYSAGSRKAKRTIEQQRLTKRQVEN